MNEVFAAVVLNDNDVRITNHLSWEGAIATLKATLATWMFDAPAEDLAEAQAEIDQKILSGRDGAVEYDFNCRLAVMRLPVLP